MFTCRFLYSTSYQSARYVGYRIEFRPLADYGIWMSDSEPRAGNTCEKCGKGELRLVVGRIGKLKEPGHTNLFQCASCGNLDFRDIPHQPPGRRT